jgi:hypothetical protein
MIRSENRRKRPKFEKFPVKFPVSREFDPETGSPLTGSVPCDVREGRGCAAHTASEAQLWNRNGPILRGQHDAKNIGGAKIGVSLLILRGLPHANILHLIYAPEKSLWIKGFFDEHES